MQRARPAICGFRAILADVEWSLFALLAVAIVFGGGGVGAAPFNMVVQLGALAILLWNFDAVRRNARAYPRLFLVLICASFALPLLQLIPLPPAIWQMLPGRELVAESLAVIGEGDNWFPISLHRMGTFVAVLGLLAPLGAIMLYRRTEGSAAAALALLVAAGIVHFLLGGVQLLVGDGTLNFYPSLSTDELHGFFANRNSSGLFFVVCLCGLLGLESSFRSDVRCRVFIVAVAVVFVLGALLTQSRSSTVLLLVPLTIACWRWISAGSGDARSRRIMIFAGVIVAGAIALVAISGGRIGSTWERFADLEDSRPDMWVDTWNGVERYWPVGSGVGTFDEVFQIEESLETLISLKAGRAHNDYLEVLLESGVFGAALILAWIVYLAWAWWRGRKFSGGAATSAATAGLLCIGLQSFVDYPLRNQTLLCVAGLLVALLVAQSRKIRDGSVE